MKDFPFTNAAISAYVHATESEEKVIGILKLLLPKGAAVNASKVKGHYGNPITMLGARAEGAAAVRELWRTIFEKLPAQEMEKIQRSVSDLVDGSCRLYLRFDKQQACEEKLVLAEGGDAIHVKFKVLVYPAKQAAAVTVVERFLHDRNV